MEFLINNITHITVIDVIDIAIIAFLFYNFMRLVQQTRAEQLIKGLIFIVIFWRLSALFGLRMVNFFIENMMTIGLVAILIVFQPELRRILEYIGRSRMFMGAGGEQLDETSAKMVEEIANAVVALSEKRIGALIVIERETGLDDIVGAGSAIDAKVSALLLRTIFPTSTPLHDGAVLIRNNRLVRAGCILPLTINDKLSSDLGTRHRAALGLIERSDALVIVVSEESGTISIAMDDKLMRYLDKNSLVSVLRTQLKLNSTTNSLRRFVIGGESEK